jgi:hypothetical protein
MPEEIQFDINRSFTENMREDMMQYYDQSVYLNDCANIRVNRLVLDIRTKSLLKISHRIHHYLASGGVNVSAEHMLCARSIKATLYALQTQYGSGNNLPVRFHNDLPGIELLKSDADFICEELECFRRALFLMQIQPLGSQGFNENDRIQQLNRIYDEMKRSLQEIRERYPIRTSP